MRKEFRSLISLEEARQVVFAHLPRVGRESVPLSEARGRILAEKIVSSLDVPGFSRASMDGFAVLAEDTLAAREDRPVSLRLAGSVPMGVQVELQLISGEAAEVSTGSMMPAGADSVVMIEYSQADGDKVLVRRPVFSGENIQAAGSRHLLWRSRALSRHQAGGARDRRSGRFRPDPCAGAKPEGGRGLYGQ